VQSVIQNSLYDFAFDEGMKDGENLYDNSGYLMVLAKLSSTGPNWPQQELQLHQDDLADKETMRVALHPIQQCRE
jgi:hypothetical protein